MSKRPMKNQDTSKDQRSGRKHPRKGATPVQILQTKELALDVRHPDSLVCINSACRAILSPEDKFCKRCSCCFCKSFDVNKDTSLWLVCVSNSGSPGCGLQCHIECAFQHERVGVVDHGQRMQLDGGYCCNSCGKITSIIGVWKLQLVVAKDASRVDDLCFRIFNCFRLLNGTLKFRELHDLVRQAKARLETEVGPLDGVSAKMAGSRIASSLSSASEVQRLVSLAIQKVDEFLAGGSSSNPNFSETPLPEACSFRFDEVTSSSVVLVLTDTSSSTDIIGYKLWYSRCSDGTHPIEPMSSFSRAQRRIMISNLQPSTEYSFRIVSYSDAGNLGQSESKCSTKSPAEVFHKDPISGPTETPSAGPTPVGSSSGFKVRDLGAVRQVAWARGEGSSEASGSKSTVGPKSPEPQPPSLGIDLNIPTVLDDDELITSGPTDDTVVVRSHGSGESQNCSNGLSREVARGSNGTGPRVRASDGLGFSDEFERCVKKIRWLECEGHIKAEFRLKMLTWFSTVATPEERRVVRTFIRTLEDDPSSLAAQLIDSFYEKIFRKKPVNGPV